MALPSLSQSHQELLSEFFSPSHDDDDLISNVDDGCKIQSQFIINLCDVSSLSKDDDCCDAPEEVHGVSREAHDA